MEVGILLVFLTMISVLWLEANTLRVGLVLFLLAQSLSLRD
jgi:hypothetical protein